MKGFFFESVEVLGGSPELGKENSGWVPSACFNWFSLIRVENHTPFVFLVSLFFKEFFDQI